MKSAGILIIGLIFLFIHSNAQPIDALRQSADKYFQAQDWGNAAKLYQQLIAQDPSNNIAWFRLGLAMHSQQKFTEAIAAYEKAESITHGPIVMYNLACAYVRAGNKDRAFVWLEQSINAKFPQLKLIQTDEELASLRSDARFADINKQIEKITRPCASFPAARQFDFWVGDWDVKAVNGQQAGTNSVQLILGECVLLENWTDNYGNSGKSINAFNKNKGYWQQTWVDDKSNVAEFVNGAFNDNAMRFTSRQTDQSGNTTLGKLTFYFLAPDKVRQHAEQSKDDGKSWTTQYDFTYYRKKQVGQNQSQ